MAQGKLDTSLNLSAMGPPSLPTSSRFASQHTQERLASQPTPTSVQPVLMHPLEIRQSMGMHNMLENLFPQKILLVISSVQLVIFSPPFSTMGESGIKDQKEVNGTESERSLTSQLEQETVGDDVQQSHAQLPTSHPPPHHLEEKTASKLVSFNSRLLS